MIFVSILDFHLESLIRFLLTPINRFLFIIHAKKILANILIKSKGNIFIIFQLDQTEFD